jgi:lipopolysaccharide transport system ATP-binding protein
MAQIGAAVELSFGIRFSSHVVGNKVKLAVQLRTLDGIPIANMIDEDSGFNLGPVAAAEAVAVTLRDLRFYPGRYLLSLWVGSADSETWDAVQDCVVLEIAEGGALARRRLPRDAGLLFLTPEWRRL